MKERNPMQYNSDSTITINGKTYKNAAAMLTWYQENYKECPDTPETPTGKLTLDNVLVFNEAGGTMAETDIATVEIDGTTYSLSDVVGSVYNCASGSAKIKSNSDYEITVGWYGSDGVYHSNSLFVRDQSLPLTLSPTPTIIVSIYVH